MSLNSVVSSAMSAMKETRKVVGRVVLSAGHVVDMKIPSQVRPGSFKNEAGSNVPFIQFPRLVKGGLVNCFVHNGHLGLKGRTVTVELSIMKKTFDDGQEYLYVDMVPVSREKRVATHRLVIIPDNGMSAEINAESQVFKTPEPVRGIIALLPRDTKIQPASSPMMKQIREIVHSAKSPSAPPSAPVAKPEPMVVAETKGVPEKPASTGDARLDVLVRQGWKFEGVVRSGMTLWRIDGNFERKEIPFTPTKRKFANRKFKSRSAEVAQ